MKCMSCGAPISPEFKSAISNNICPACGGEIMNEATLDLLDDLKEALQSMPNDPEGLAGWLLSNYEMRKIGNADPVTHFYGSPNHARLDHQAQMQPRQAPQEGQKLNVNPHYQQFIPKNQRPDSFGGGMVDRESQLREQPRVAENKLQQFYSNAGIKPKSQNKYASLAQQIQGDDYGNDYGNQEYNQEDFVDESYDPEFTEAALGASMMNERPMSAQERAELAQIMGGGDNNFNDSYDSYDDNETYDLSLPPALNMQRRDRLKKQQDLSMGGKVGKISRRS